MTISMDGFEEKQQFIALLYRRYARWLHSRIRLEGFGDVAEDIVQETFIRLAASSAAIDLHRPQAFLLTIARNLLRDNARRAKAIKRTAAENIFSDCGVAGSTEQFETVLIKQVILALPIGQREVFLLSRYAGLPYEEIARLCGISVKTVESRMAKAVAKCASILRD